ncbi:hypothetical protein FB451DRAFT_1560097 [Mycena latifolia]|nr:hypothetical protein FB451DRAFT_1560097 [Mycena latifolia]
MARRDMGFLAPALVDLASVLTTDPANTEASSAFDDITTRFVGRIESLLPKKYFNSIIPLPTDQQRRAPQLIWKQSKDWLGKNFPENPLAEHKIICSTTSSNTLTMRLGRGIFDHVYTRTHLILYGMRALGILHDPRPSYRTVLMVHVTMIPMCTRDGTRTRRKRVSVSQLLAVPLAILPDDMIGAYNESLHLTSTRPQYSGMMGMLIVPSTTREDGVTTQSRIITVPLPTTLLHEATDPEFKLTLYSQSRGMERRIPVDMDLLHASRSIEDELAMDFDNFYKLQR